MPRLPGSRFGLCLAPHEPPGKWAGLDSNQRRLTPTGLQPVFQDSQPSVNNTLIERPGTCLQASLQEDSENDLELPVNLPDGLAQIVAAWSELPEHIRAAIKTLVTGHTGGNQK